MEDPNAKNFNLKSLAPSKETVENIGVITGGTFITLVVPLAMLLYGPDLLDGMKDNELPDGYTLVPCPEEDIADFIQSVAETGLRGDVVIARAPDGECQFFGYE